MSTTGRPHSRPYVSRKKGAWETFGTEVLFYLARCGVIIQVKGIPMTPLC